jgi:mycofactocin system transcriptional regulator
VSNGSVGRPQATTYAAIEQAAFRLFTERGFEETTLDDIAREVGVARRTLFGYYRSKNDIPWGEFGRTLDAFRNLLDAMPDDMPLIKAVGRGVVEFNRFPADASPPHVDRMRLILMTPTLQAHSVLRYAEWRQVIAEFAARRLDVDAYSLEPQLLGHMSLAVALTAYDQWLRDPLASLPDLIERALVAMGTRFLESVQVPTP